MIIKIIHIDKNDILHIAKITVNLFVAFPVVVALLLISCLWLPISWISKILLSMRGEKND